jgi:hypothetical protein
LLDDAGQVTAPPGQRQLQRRDRHPKAASSIRRRRPGVRLGDRQVGDRLVQAPLGEVTHRAHQGQLGGVRARREGPHQRLDSLGLPVEGQAERMVGQQPDRISPVARRLDVPDGLGHLAMLGEPPGGAPVQNRHLFGQRPAQLQPQEIREQVVVAEPRALGVQRFDERVGVLEVEQDPFRARPAGQQIGQFTVDPLEQAGAQQQILDLVWLAFQHLGDQVLGDRAVAAGELGDEPRGVGVASQGDRREPQARGPSLRPLAQQRRAGLGQRDPGGLEKLAGLALGEAQIRRADLGQLAGQAQPMQPQPQIATGGQDSVHMWRKVRQQLSELAERSRRVQLVEIVDDQRDAAARVGELAEHSVGDRLDIEVRCRSRRFRVAGCAGGMTDGIKQGQPELLGVFLVAPHRHEGDAMRPIRIVCPRAQQRGLPAASRSGDDRHFPRCRAIQSGEKIAANDKPESVRATVTRLWFRQRDGVNHVSR